MPVASLSHLSVRYGSRTVINDLNLQIPEGCVGLLGHNGAGKTTLIKTMLGFLKPAEGSGKLLQLDITTEGMQIRQKIGLMPEIDCHIPGMNAVSFVSYAGELAGMPSNAALSRAHEVLEYCGLADARYRNIETYSTGMKQRIKLAQALVHGPQLVFLDEPTNGLDPKGRDEMLALIRDLAHDKGVNVIVSSHLMPDIEQTCDHVIVLSSGKVATEGSLESLRSTQSVQVEVELHFASEPFTNAMKTRGADILQNDGSRLRLGFSQSLAEGDNARSLAQIGRELFVVARETGAQVRGFRLAHRSLEDVFIASAD